jgi:hypothetical protein
MRRHLRRRLHHVRCRVTDVHSRVVMVALVVANEVEPAAKVQLKANFTVRVTFGVPMWKQGVNGPIRRKCGLQ